MRLLSALVLSLRLPTPSSFPSACLVIPSVSLTSLICLGTSRIFRGRWKNSEPESLNFYAIFGKGRSTRMRFRYSKSHNIRNVRLGLQKRKFSEKTRAAQSKVVFGGTAPISLLTLIFANSIVLVDRLVR